METDKSGSTKTVMDVIKAFIDTPYRDDFSCNHCGYNEIPEQYKYHGNLNKSGRVITVGDIICGDNLHGYIFNIKNSKKYKGAGEFSIIYNNIRYIMTCYGTSIQIFKDVLPVPDEIDKKHYLCDGYLNCRDRSVTILPNDSDEYHQLLIIFSTIIKGFAENRGLFRIVTPEKLDVVQRIVDSDCFILLHSSDGHIVNAKIENGFWNT